jgi:hypothetical protein
VSYLGVLPVRIAVGFDRKNLQTIANPAVFDALPMTREKLIAA